ncbi:phospholipase D family protein [Acinetobacter sp. YH16032]|uniref:phospholipase D family protein n=1 Tax=Acinetobacter sp. YH16032 TaxID=2601181 RepID=UPI0035A158D6
MLMLRYILCLLTFFILTGCNLAMNTSIKQAPIQPHTTHWLSNTPETKRNIEQGLTAFLPLHDPFMSMASRVHLIREAQHTIDLQYYIWENDVIGQHLLSDLLKAADRNVKVRLLIDDQNGTQLDSTLSALSEHPNIEIKLFNPYKFRSFRVLDYVFRFNKINHRMHNKLIIADGAIAVTGGRNISNEYFDASDNFQFADMDILFAGQSVSAANTVFHQFWNDELSYDIQQIIPESQKELAHLRSYYSTKQNFQGAETKKRIDQAERFLEENLKKHPIRWSKAHFVADSPNKIRAKAQSHELLFNQFKSIMGKPAQEINLVSAYFVPTVHGESLLKQLSEQNVKVRVLTNSYLANDVPIVHAFYQKYRTSLLRSDVKLYEFKPYIERSDRTWYEIMTGNVIPAKGKNASRLHAKFFTVDDKVFIGTFNFDPRSAYLNTELGLIIESADFKTEISQSLNENLPKVAYQLHLDAHQNLRWEEQRGEEKLIHDHDPETTRFQRFMFKSLSYLPIEWMM